MHKIYNPRGEIESLDCWPSWETGDVSCRDFSLIGRPGESDVITVLYEEPARIDVYLNRLKMEIGLLTEKIEWSSRCTRCTQLPC